MLAPEIVRRAVEAHGPFVAALYGGELEERDGFYLARNRWVDEPEWNHAGRLRLRDDDALAATIEAARRDLAAAGRSLTLVADPFQLPGDLEAQLKDRGWTESFRHSGLIWPGNGLSSREVGWPAAVAFEEIQSVAGAERGLQTGALLSMEAFVSVFEESFAEVAAGHLSHGYRSAFPASLRPRVGGVDVIHTLVRVEGEPAAIGSRAIGFGVAGLYNLGVAPRFRRLGLGGAITLHRIAAAQAGGAEVVYLLTEDPRVEASQLRRGFVKAFDLTGMEAPG